MNLYKKQLNYLYSKGLKNKDINYIVNIFMDKKITIKDKITLTYIYVGEVFYEIKKNKLSK